MLVNRAIPVTMTSKRLDTALAYIGHFASIDASVLERILADNFVQNYAPASIPNPGPFDKPGLISLTRHMNTLLSGFPMLVKEVIESDKSNAVTIWVTGEATFRDEVRDDGLTAEEWVHKGEYIFLIFLDESGEKIVRTTEFVDSKATLHMVELAPRATENLSKKEISH